MILPLFPLVKLIVSGGGDSADSSGKVKIPTKMLFDGQPLRTGPDNGFNTFTHAKKGDDAAVIGRNADGSWLFLWCDSGDGWVHATTVLADGDTDTLPLWDNPIQGFIYKPEGQVTRPTDLKNGADAAYETLVCIPPNTDITMMALSENGHWAFIRSAHGDGWIPRSAITTHAPFDFLPTWKQPIKGAMYKPKGTVTPSHLHLHAGADWKYDKVGTAKKGDNIKVMARNPKGDWLFIWSDAGDGWVPANQIATGGDHDKLSIWSAPMHGQA